MKQPSPIQNQPQNPSTLTLQMTIFYVTANYFFNILKLLFGKPERVNEKSTKTKKKKKKKQIY